MDNAAELEILFGLVVPFCNQALVKQRFHHDFWILYSFLSFSSFWKTPNTKAKVSGPGLVAETHFMS